MKYIKTIYQKVYEKLSYDETNPLLIQLYEKIIEITNEFEFEIKKETSDEYAAIVFTNSKYKLSTLITDNRNFKSFVMNDDAKTYSDQMKDLVTFMKTILPIHNGEDFYFKYTETFNFINKLNDFELWRDTLKYNL